MVGGYIDMVYGRGYLHYGATTKWLIALIAGTTKGMIAIFAVIKADLPEVTAWLMQDICVLYLKPISRIYGVEF
ncbi:hypothetical protein KDA_03240 [Dictyobacter alpinus]|uniref:Uncharacterized protein n=1 Tax=Dictyobacter alpinus TaxID=2014873 RepID=A0A402B0H0_9CHLR|nr:hypothetical protein KDA_03240 [Dictyobacter alpinus]